nr:photosystem II core complex proteins psbY, chloroplastic-like isoform X2 [Malus domestica]
MAATIGTSMAALSHRCFTFKSSKNMITYKPTMKIVSFSSIKYQPKSFTSFKSPINSKHSTSIITAVVSTLISCDSAFAAVVAAETGEGDKRVLALLIPIVAAILWVLYNILGPALNQIDRMRSEKW